MNLNGGGHRRFPYAHGTHADCCVAAGSSEGCVCEFDLSVRQSIGDWLFCEALGVQCR